MSPRDPVRSSSSINTESEANGSGRDERILGKRLLDGDADAAREIYLRYFERLVRFAFSYVRSRSVAEEIVQDAFLAIWERRDSLEFTGGIRAYLYAAVRNRALKHEAHERVVERSTGQFATHGEDDQVPGMGSAPPIADEAIAEHELIRLVAQVIDAMPERRRLAITLRWRHQLPYAEIAQIMGSSVEAVTIQVARARETLAKAMERYR